MIIIHEPMDFSVHSLHAKQSQQLSTNIRGLLDTVPGVLSINQSVSQSVTVSQTETGQRGNTKANKTQ